VAFDRRAKARIEIRSAGGDHTEFAGVPQLLGRRTG